MAPSPTLEVELEWTGDLHFAGRAGPRSIELDGDAERAPSPLSTLAASLAGCMAIDVVHILERMRTPPASLHLSLRATRAPEEPRRLVSVDLRCDIGGDVPEKNVRRALELSRERYCSVWYSLRPDIELVTSFEVRPQRPDLVEAGLADGHQT